MNKKFLMVETRYDGLKHPSFTYYGPFVDQREYDLFIPFLRSSIVRRGHDCSVIATKISSTPVGELCSRPEQYRDFVAEQYHDY